MKYGMSFIEMDADDVMRMCDLKVVTIREQREERLNSFLDRHISAPSKFFLFRWLQKLSPPQTTRAEVGCAFEEGRYYGFGESLDYTLTQSWACDWERSVLKLRSLAAKAKSEGSGKPKVMVTARDYSLISE